MESDTRTLVLLLCMHRSGSSLAASAFQQLGMSLGPFPLVEPNSSNVHGHFESWPLVDLNRRVLDLAFGFPDDADRSHPKSDLLFARVMDHQGIWPEGFDVPGEMVQEGRRLIAGLVESGEVSGFKDPRTVLAWPFWRQVLEAFPTLRVVVVPLLRSPHEIAMSLCTRSESLLGYWRVLDLTAVHFQAMKAILEVEGQASSAAVRFGHESYLDDLAGAARSCGLTWNEHDALRVFDRACVHQEPASVDHEAQRLYETLGGPRRPDRHGEQVGRVLARDARTCEDLSHRRLLRSLEERERCAAQLVEVHNHLSWARDELSRIGAETEQVRGELDRARGELDRRAASSTGGAASSTGRAASSTGRAASSTGRAASSTGRAASSTTPTALWPRRAINSR